MADASTGVLSHLSLGAVGTTVASFSEAYEFISENVQKRGTIIETGGIRGTRSHPKERTVPGEYTVGGQIVFDATPSMLDLLLPRILGAAESSDTFALDDALPAFDVLIDRVAKRFTYGDCKVNRATFSGAPGQPLRLALDIIGKTETVASTSFPTITAPTDTPYAFHQLVGTLVSSARIIKNIEIVIDNALEARTSNSQSVTSIMPTDRTITVRLTTPYTSSETDLYGQTLLGSAGTLVWTNGNTSTTFTFATLQVADQSPVISGKAEIDLVTEGVARMSSTTRELVVTHDSTP